VSFVFSPEFFEGVLDVPATLAKAADDRAVDVLVGEERKAPGHYWPG